MKLIRSDGELILIAEESTILGRQPTQGHRIVHPTISREHARIFLRTTGWQVADLNSSNGTYVNDEKVSLAPLKHGDVLRLGEVALEIDLSVESRAESPTDDDFEIDDFEIELEEPATLSSDSATPAPPRPARSEATTLPPGRPAHAAPATTPMGKRSSGLSAKGEQMLQARLQSQRGGGESVLASDVAQYSGLRQFIMVVGVLAISAALFMGVMKLTEEVVPEGDLGFQTAPPSDDDQH